MATQQVVFAKNVTGSLAEASLEFQTIQKSSGGLCILADDRQGELRGLPQLVGDARSPFCRLSRPLQLAALPLVSPSAEDVSSCTQGGIERKSCTSAKIAERRVDVMFR